MLANSFHTFMFPFSWYLNGADDKVLSKQIALKDIEYGKTLLWRRKTLKSQTDGEEAENLYNEQNYFYKFVHDALYDTGKDDVNNLIRHFERVEPCEGAAKYVIRTKGNVYELVLEDISLDLYSTGVGVLSFYLRNDKYDQMADILVINQYGRRVFPPFWADINIRNEIAQGIEITGLNGVYAEDFCSYKVTDSWKPAPFITKMINEVATNVKIEPVIDDRMYVMSWFRNNGEAMKACEYKKYGETEYFDLSLRDYEAAYNNWYKYVFVDAEYPTCHNPEMFKELIDKSTYRRWQDWDSLYGISRYSFVMLTSETCPPYLLKYFETEYVRMAQLVLVQKASFLRFSREITNLSSLDSRKNLSEKADSLYKEYIRFVNQIHFREISAQDQAIELYQKLYKQMDIEHQVKMLDEEMEELKTYIDHYEDGKKTKVMDIMSYCAGVALPVSIITGFFGMNSMMNGAGESESLLSSFTFQWILCLLAPIIMVIILRMKIKK